MIIFDNIHINPITIEDAWRLCNFAVANEDRLLTFFPKTLEQNLTPTLSTDFAKRKVNQFRLKEEFLYTIRQNDLTELVGLVYIKELDWDKKEGEFAYAIGYPFEGKGLMSKAVQALSNYAFNTIGLKTLRIISHKSNFGSVKVAERCGFKWIETLPNEFVPKNRAPLNMELYELYNEG